MQGGAFGAQAPAVGGVLRVTAHALYLPIFGFDENAAADAAVATSRFDFSLHDFPSGMPSATGMPPRKIMDLERKRGNPIVEFPLFGALNAVAVPI
jgi:hypothetical protein